MSQPAVPKIPLNRKSLFQMPTPLLDVTLNPEIFEQFIQGKGIRMIHSRPVPCPKVRDVHGADHSLSCNLCHNGYLYYGETEFKGGFFGNDLHRNFNVNGSWDIDQANIIVPVKDNAGNILDVQYYDQIIIPDISVRYYQRIEHSQSGVDRAQFNILSVDFIVDYNGKMYRPGVDFVADKGKVVWISNNRPGYNPGISRGTIYSINYYTNPIFTVVGLPHQIRMTQTQTAPGQPNVEARFPQLCICRKDFIPFDSNDHTGEPDRPEPRDGSFV